MMMSMHLKSLIRNTIEYIETNVCKKMSTEDISG